MHIVDSLHFESHSGGSTELPSKGSLENCFEKSLFYVHLSSLGPPTGRRSEVRGGVPECRRAAERLGPGWLAPSLAGWLAAPSLARAYAFGWISASGSASLRFCLDFDLDSA